jgi:autotransporter strand-loop-strand O-heptosyltransferase
MLFNKIIGHCSFISHTGYANHSRSFFTKLNNHIPVRIRNFTWIDKFDHLDSIHEQLVIEQTWKEPPWKFGKPFLKHPLDKILNIVLMETNHFYYYHEYDEPVIGYNVWESTRQPEDFFKQWLKFLQLWVPTKWQRDCTIEQGCPPDRVKIVPEGVDGSVFFPSRPELKLKEYNDNRFKFLVFGRWDYRKSTEEIIRTFLNTFKQNEPVDLILSVDNPFPADGLKSTEERLKKFRFIDKRLKILHFPNRQEYVSHLKSGHCFISCARAEGWNLPLSEAIACGIPTIASNYGAQLDFAEGISHLVNIKEHLRSKQVFMQNDNDLSGTYAEPDFEHLSYVMRDVFENYKTYKIKALADSEIIRNKFSWENAVDIALSHIREITENDIKEHKKRIFKTPEESVFYNFHNGAFCEIKGPKMFDYHIKFIDMDTNEIIHQETVKTNHWVRTNRKYLTNWKITVEVNNKLYHEHIFNLTNKNVIIVLDSTAMGDKLCWVPYIDEFRKKYKCNVYAATGFNWMFKESYPEINFIDYGVTLPDIYAVYNIVIEDQDFDSNKNNWHLIPLQQAITDFLGLEYKEIRPLINVKKLKRPIKEKYICIAEHSTFRCKYWNNPIGWQRLVDHLNKIGYKVMVITREKSLLKHVIHKTNKTLNETINNLQHCEFFIGISSGLAWLAWGLNIPVVVISGCTKPFVEMQDCIRIFNPDVCNGCFNDPDINLEKGDWDFCPRRQNYICSTSITPEMVIEQIQPLIKI